MSGSAAPSSIKYSHTLWSPSDTILDVAEVLGISNLPDEVAKSLAMEVEYRIHEVVEEAVKFMRHSRRTTLTTQDISSAYRVLNVEPLYGYDTTRPLIYKEAMVGPGQTLYYVDDDDVDFEKIINQPLPKVPRATSFTAHWLAIEGVQPAIPQNPLPSEVKVIPPHIRGSQATHSVSALASDVEVKPLVKHVISKELQIYFDRVVDALVQPPKDDPASVANTTDKTESTGDPSSPRNIALNSLRNDPGLHQLVPYLIQFVQEQISQNLKSNVPIVSTMLEVIHAMIDNPNIFIDPYIHQIVPCLLTPILCRYIGKASTGNESEVVGLDTQFESSYTTFDNNSNSGSDNPRSKLDAATRESYAVRDFAASLLSSICHLYGTSYYSLKPRVARTLLKGFLDANRTVSAWYGSIMGLRGLGPEIVRVFIVGNLKLWYKEMPKHVSDPRERGLLSYAILDALRMLKKQVPTLMLYENDGSSKNVIPLTQEEDKNLKDLVGEDLVEFLMRQNDGVEIGRALVMEQKLEKS